MTRAELERELAARGWSVVGFRPERQERVGNTIKVRPGHYSAVKDPDGRGLQGAPSPEALLECVAQYDALPGREGPAPAQSAKPKPAPPRPRVHEGMVSTADLRARPQ